MTNTSANAMGSVGQVAVAGTHGIVGGATGVSNPCLTCECGFCGAGNLAKLCQVDA